MALTQRIGVSTHFLPAVHGEDLWVALQQVLEAGIRGIELVPADYQGRLNTKYTIRNVGLWPRGFGRADRNRLRGMFAQFDTVTIHSPHLGLNIASVNPGIRDETARQYIECIQLAIDTGARVVTFHPGKQTPGILSDPEDIIRPMVRFGKLACEIAEEHGIRFGYEARNFEQLKRVIKEVNNPRFGICLDLGHMAMGGHAPREWIEHFGDSIVEVHVNGVYHDVNGMVEHQPLDRNNVIDYEDTLSALYDCGYAGPFQCELQGLDIADTLLICLDARERLNAIWSGLSASVPDAAAGEAADDEALGEDTPDEEDLIPPGEPEALAPEQGRTASDSDEQS